MLIVWVIGAPLLVLTILVRNRHNLEEPHVKRYFLVLYQGLKPHTYYWEFVNTIRKVVLPAFSVVLATYRSFYRAIVAIIVLIFLFRVQLRLQPYKYIENNYIEMLAITTGIVTLFGGILFIEESDSSVEFVQLFALIIILLMNIYFILRWIHLMLYSFKSQNPFLVVSRKILGYAIMRNEKAEILSKELYKMREYENSKTSMSTKPKDTKKRKSSRKKVSIQF